MDFTLNTYRRLLLALKCADYKFITFNEWCKNKIDGKYVILRHDIDSNAKRALEIAKIEAELNIHSTYYFITVNKVFKPYIVKRISGLGHEVGYHYRDFVDSSGETASAFNSFRKNIEKLRNITVVDTIAMDGCPWSKYDNRDLWKTYNYRDFGIIGEPYFDFLTPENLEKGVLYFTDTARMWDGDKFNVRDKVVESSKFMVDSKKQTPKIHSTHDFINWLETEKPANSMMISTHPQRWTDNKIAWCKELVLQSIKNEVKRIIISGNR